MAKSYESPIMQQCEVEWNTYNVVYKSQVLCISFSTYNTTKLSSNETINIDLFMPISNTLMFALTFKILISICWFLRSKECKLCLPIPGVVVLWCMFWHLLKPHLDILNYLLCRSLEIYMYIYDAKTLFEHWWHFLLWWQCKSFLVSDVHIYI